MLGRGLTRRQALRLGAGAVALGALRSPAIALAGRPALFELPIDADGAHAAGAGWRTTAVLRAPRRFDLVGLRWARGGRLEAQVRARRRGGEWTPWATLHVLGDHAPDGEGPPPGTDPAFVGTADELQLRLRGSARQVRAQFVRALPIATAAGRLAARARRRGGARRAPVARAAVARPPAIIPRSAWGAETVPPRAAPQYGVVEAAFVHHTVTTNSYTPAQSAAIVLGIARYHRDSNGWNDIGYNFLVDRYGQVFEGRAGGIAAAVVGAQAQGYNAQSTGIASIGTFSSVGQTAAGMQALARLIGWKLSVHAVPTHGSVTLISAGGPFNRYASGTPVTVQRICGHRDGDATSCPGSALYGQLPALRTRAARYAGPVQGVTLRGASVQRGTAPVALAGTLRFADGASPAGAIVSAEYSPDGAAWTTLASATCAPGGAWTASAVLPASGQVRAVFGGDATHGRLASGPIGIVVVPTLRLSLAHRRVPVGGLLAITGSMAPPAAAVTIVVERRSGLRWVRVTRKHVPVRDGAFATAVRLGRPGIHRVSVVAGGVTRHRTVRIIP